MTDALSRWHVKPEPIGNQSGTSSAATGSGVVGVFRPHRQPNRTDGNRTETEAERYAVAMTDAATTWITAHPELYRRMVDGTMGQYRGQPGEFALRMAGLMRACADAAGFPSLAIWLERAA